MTERKNELAPCGVFCAACPSFNKTCAGCSSENHNQKRKSKWSCKIRQCCYDKKKIAYCAYCKDFPCEIINKKLIKSHEGDNRFKYRHDIPGDMEIVKVSGVENFIELKRKEYLCAYCGGSVYFYSYKCSQCGREVDE